MSATAHSFSINSAPMSFMDNTLDRQSVKRSDNLWINERMAHPQAGLILCTPSFVLLDGSLDNPLRHPIDQINTLGIQSGEVIFLGQQTDGSHPLFAAMVLMSDEEVEVHPAFSGRSLRDLSLTGDVSGEDLGALAQARAMLHWHHTHRFCSKCGHASIMSEAGYRRDCPSCNTQHFPRTDPVVIMLITDGKRALLGQPAHLQSGLFTTLAGFMEPGETVEQAVRRETMEEAGIEVGKVKLTANQPWPFPGSLMLGCIGQAESLDIHIDENELQACNWYEKPEVFQMLEGKHPQEHRLPPSISISHHLIVNWLNGDLTI